MLLTLKDSGGFNAGEANLRFDQSLSERPTLVHIVVRSEEVCLKQEGMKPLSYDCSYVMTIVDISPYAVPLHLCP